ncbi:thiol peroxidase, atypical 2-Cys peroxiredoxin [Pustulibacterium marinum]|uniref:Thiol peroxidase n=1 Tax=Pustulibacterium marinum TaxID=1224947 RepID=A0A1I7INH6_9FLAO|nr:thiol peroxidase [Pustulibacterium marinum]SFU74477.1 thiol peroxidase, atypical 2-Cys peroxiredoxin [Pustulibacterium marinum]
MATITFKGSDVNTKGSLPTVGEKAPEFTLTSTDLSSKTLADFAGSKLVLNIFPSVDTGVCAASVRKFNEEASTLENTKVLCISKDLPFAFNRFCGAEGLEDVISLSDFKGGFSAYETEFTDGPLAGLLSRAVVVLDEEGKVLYTEQVAETTEEPNYEEAIAALK